MSGDDGYDSRKVYTMFCAAEVVPPADAHAGKRFRPWAEMIVGAGHLYVQSPCAVSGMVCLVAVGPEVLKDVDLSEVRWVETFPELFGPMQELEAISPRVVESNHVRVESRHLKVCGAGGVIHIEAAVVDGAPLAAGWRWLAVAAFSRSGIKDEFARLQCWGFTENDDSRREQERCVVEA